MPLNFDYQVRLIQFPNKKTREVVTPNEDGTYTIFIESSLSKEEQRCACSHALSHIVNRDFSKTISVDEIERNAHEIT